MKESKNEEIILWAVDPFEANYKLQCSAGAALRALMKSGAAKIYPVYICPRAQADLVAIHGGTLAETIEVQANRAFRRILGPVKVPGLMPLHLLLGKDGSHTGGTRELLRYAKEKRASLIVLSTHGRKGPSRWLVGSFAETLMLRAEVPLLIVNPNWKPKSSFRDILFPTDFSTESRLAFSKVLEMAARQKSRVTIFHKIPLTVVPLGEFSYIAASNYARLEEAEVSSAKKKSAAWAAEAKKLGVETKVEINRIAALSASEAILRRAAREDCLIAMAARSGRVVSALLGSATRQVIRGAKQPVWILHPDVKSARKDMNVKLTQEEVLEDLAC